MCSTYRFSDLGDQPSSRAAFSTEDETKTWGFDDDSYYAERRTQQTSDGRRQRPNDDGWSEAVVNKRSVWTLRRLGDEEETKKRYELSL